jgi:hypothetical protein
VVLLLAALLTTCIVPLRASAQASPLTAQVDVTATSTRPGATLAYTVTARSDAPRTLRVSVALDATLVLLGSASAEGPCVAAESLVCTLQTNGANMATISFQARVRADAPAGATIQVQATVSADDASANASAAPVVVQAEVSATATATSGASATATPGATARTAAVTSTATRTAAPTRTATLPANARPDACEPNSTPQQACVLGLDSVNGPFTFLPEPDVDVYSLDLGVPSGLDTTITVRATEGLDLLTTIQRPDTGERLAVISSPTISATLPASLAGWVLLTVENRGASLATGESYRIEVRRTLPPAPSAFVPAGERPALQPDRLENNWSGQTAAPIGVGVAYELNFVCPVAGGCEGGDFDYLRAAVKGGVPYVISTFDLAPGVDTVIDLFWQDEAHPAGGSDDWAPGKSFLSLAHWTAPADGYLLIRVGPRTGGLNPIVFDEEASRYKVAIALADSDLGRQIEARVFEQSGIPAPTAVPLQLTPAPVVSAQGGQVASAPPASTAIPVTTDGVQGQAVVVRQGAPLLSGPDAEAETILTLSEGSAATLLGAVSGAWARVQPANSVVPGWMRATDLQRQTTPVEAPAALRATPAADAAGGGVAGSEAAPSVTPPSGADIVVAPMEPLASVSAAPQASQVSLDVPVTVQRSNQVPLAGLRVQVVNALGDVLAVAVTGADGRVTITVAALPNTALLLEIPALGLRTPIDATAPAMAVAVPGADQ